LKPFFQGAPTRPFPAVARNQRGRSLRHLFLFLLCVYSLNVHTLSSFLPRPYPNFILLAMVGLFGSLFYSGHVLSGRGKIRIEGFLFLAWLLWAFIGMIDRSLFFWDLINQPLAGVLLFLYFSSSISNRDQLTFVLKGFLTGGLLLVAAIFITGEFAEFESRTGAFSTSTTKTGLGMFLTGNRNTFAYLILLSIFAAFYSISVARFRWRIVLLVSIAAFSVFIVLSASRKAFIVEILFILIWAYLTNARMLARRTRFVVLFLILSVVLYHSTTYVYDHTYLGERLQPVESFESGGLAAFSGVSSRISQYEVGLNLFLDYPIWGVGLGNYSKFDPSGLSPHSEYVAIGTQTGLVGLLLYFTPYVLMLSRLRKQRKAHAAFGFAGGYDYKAAGCLFAITMSILIIDFGRWNFSHHATYILLGSICGYSYHLQAARSKTFVDSSLRSLPDKTMPAAR